MPALPKRLPNGNYPLLEASRVNIARKLIRLRKSVELSQVELAWRAGIRVETLNRLEKAKHMPDAATVEKIFRALRDAGAKGV
jgi:predicted transcriptional regulator